MAWGLARAQHGVLSRGQLLGLGYSRAAIEHRLGNGRLHRLHRGVYAVGLPRGTDEQRWIAAVLACAREPAPSDGVANRPTPGDAALSHGSAAALWRIGTEKPGRIDVSVRRRVGPRRAGIRARAWPSLSAADIVWRRGIPVTAPARTLVDLAAELPIQRVERAVNEADKRDLIDPEALRVALDGYAGAPGVKALRTLLDRLTFRLSDRELEVLFRPIASAAGLPVPLTKQWVNDFEVDFFWPGIGLVVETDGLRYHRTPSAQNRDLLRDQTHTAAGLTRLRFSHYQVKYERQRVRSVLARTAKRLGG